jgi:hypothetical protein
LRKIIGPSAYKACAGSCTWLNGVFWVRILREVPDGVLIENLHNVGKIKLPRVRCAIEKELLYPLLRGRDVRRWEATPSAHLILTQDPETRAGIPEEEMRQRYPLTWAYLKRFEAELRGRSGFRKYFTPTDPFYSMYNVGPYTLAKFKVVWPEVGNEVRCAVVDAFCDEPNVSRIVIPDHTVILLACGSREEAHFVCGLLNSAPARLLVKSYIVLHPSPHVLQNVHIPRFRWRLRAHRAVVKTAGRMACLAINGRCGEMEQTRLENDRAAAELWGLSEDELRGIQEALGEDQSRTEQPALLREDAAPYGEGGEDEVAEEETEEEGGP